MPPAQAKQAATKKQVGAARQANAQDDPLSNAPRDVSAQVQMVFPSILTPRQRAAVHAVGEQYGLAHSSTGEDAERRVALGPIAAPKVQIKASKGELDDADLVQLIQEHLRIDASAAFAERPATGLSNGAASKAPAAHKFSRSSPAGRLDLDQFVGLMTELLELERRAEMAAAEDALSASSPEAAQSRGQVLLNLRLTDAEGGLLGRTLLTLVNNKGVGAGALPPHKFSPHDIVRLRPSRGDAGGPSLAEGLVYRVEEGAITVAVDDVPDEGLDVPLRLEKLANEVTYQRLKLAMRDLSTGASAGPAAALVDVLFGHAIPRFASSPPPWTPLNAALDESQRRAVSLGLAAADIALIHGPPGTGKTTAVVELICQEVARGSRVLACAASNVACDNLVERLAAQRLPGGRRLDIVRVGHPARLLPAVLECSLEARVLRSDSSALARDCRKEIKDINARLLKLERKDRDERTQLRAELRQLSKEERQRQQRAIGEVLGGAQVVCATLTGVGTRQLAALPAFDVVVIDEAAQALEPACWAALLRGRRAILAGDHLQLPPTVISEEAARRGLLTTLFERAHAQWGGAAAEMLTLQYRMNASIMDWASREMYEGRLQAAEDVAGHTLADIPGVTAAAAGELPVLLLIDSAGCEMEESQEESGGESKCNQGEARAAMEHVRRLMAAGIKPQDIGVITPYRAQVGFLRELRAEGAAAAAVEISTVDGFQGREKEAIVICAVRSNALGEVGFVADSRRMNVAVTRARRHCALVCNSETLGTNPFLGRLVTYFFEHGEYASAQEYVDA